MFGKGAYGKEIEIEEIFSNKKLELSEEDILKNVQEIQKEQELSGGQVFNLGQAFSRVLISHLAFFI
ncbi:MAG: hypothetical protein ACC651_08025 [Candidatus Scalindua sp.]